MLFDTSLLDDIPGTKVFTFARAKQGYNINMFCMSLMKAENRDRFRADEPAYLDEWHLTPKAKQAILDRNLNAAMEEGAGIYYLAHLALYLGISIETAVSTMTDMNPGEFHQMMLSGGRSPEGWRSIKEGN